jgi:hypothetical protein
MLSARKMLLRQPLFHQHWAKLCRSLQTLKRVHANNIRALEIRSSCGHRFLSSQDRPDQPAQEKRSVEAVSRSDVIIEEFQIPSTLARHVIGPAGVVIDSIVKESGADVKVERQGAIRSETVKVTLKGTKDSVLKARALIDGVQMVRGNGINKESSSSSGSQNTAKKKKKTQAFQGEMFVKKIDVGRVCGRGGKNLEFIMAETVSRPLHEGSRAFSSLPCP